MKKSELLVFFGNCVIAVAIIIAGCLIAFHLPETTMVPSNLTVRTVQVEAEQQFGDYLSRYEVAAYLRISDDEANELIESGALDSAICKIGNTYIFSKSALQKWVEQGLSN